MREINFRAWQKNRKAMTYTFDVIAFSTNDIGSFGEDANEIVWFDKSILMQYTGLKDKNGKEVYEGDIVKIGDKRLNDYSTDIAEVVFYRGGFMLHLKGYFGYRDIERIDGDCKRHEIIGNIYENPELLRDAE